MHSLRAHRHRLPQLCVLVCVWRRRCHRAASLCSTARRATRSVPSPGLPPHAQHPCRLHNFTRSHPIGTRPHDALAHTLCMAGSYKCLTSGERGVPLAAHAALCALLAASLTRSCTCPAPPALRASSLEAQRSCIAYAQPVPRSHARSHASSAGLFPCVGRGQGESERAPAELLKASLPRTS